MARRRPAARTTTTAVSVAVAALVMGVLAPVAANGDTPPVPAPAPTPTVTPAPTPVAIPPVTPTPPKSAPVLRTWVGLSVSPVATTVRPRVGVGYPLVVTFAAPVQRRAAAERGLTVTIKGTPVRGAWSWRDSRTVMYRPQRGFWPAQSTISVAAGLHKTVLRRQVNNRGVVTQQWLGSRATTAVFKFRTARSFIAYVDARTDRMIVKRNGRRVANLATSLGKAGYLTRSGIKVTTDKYATRRMTSQEAGITNETYDVTATWAVRLTPTGEFIHGAPWAEGRGRLGRYNGSHGCTNLSSADAKWYFDRVIAGDPVVTTGTARAMEWTNGLGGPWNIPWQVWLSRSKLKGR